MLITKIIHAYWRKQKHIGKYKEDRKHLYGFPGASVVKNPFVNAGDTGSIPGVGKSHMSQSN